MVVRLPIGAGNRIIPGGTIAVPPEHFCAMYPDKMIEAPSCEGASLCSAAVLVLILVVILVRVLILVVGLVLLILLLVLVAVLILVLVIHN